MLESETNPEKFEYKIKRDNHLQSLYALPTVLSIEYPGIVQDTDAALEKFKGKQLIQQCWYKPRETLHQNSRRPNPNAKLHLYFRPNDLSSHPLVSDDSNDNAMKTIYVIGRRYRKKLPDGTFKFKNKYEFLGISPFTYKFSNLADFQFLPINSKGKLIQDLDGLSLQTCKPPEFFLEDSDPNLVAYPAAFSRFTRPDYKYQWSNVGSGENKSKKKKDTTVDKIEDSKTKTIRKKRAIDFGQCSVATYNELARPSADDISNFIKKSPIKNQVLMDKLKKIFEKRPIWLFRAIEVQLSEYSNDTLKQALPYVSFSFTDGPWQRSRCAYDFDPFSKLNREKALPLQVTDLRMTPERFPISEDDRAKIDGLYGSDKSKERYSHSLATLRKDDVVSDLQKSEALRIAESFYIYRENMIPLTTQVYYQLIDIELDSVKDILKNEKRSNSVDPRLGWFADPQFMTKIRKFVKQSVENKIKADIASYN